MNSLLQPSYISALRAQYSKVTQTRLQDRKTIIQIQNQ